jgi:hypothetical protein
MAGRMRANLSDEKPTSSGSATGKGQTLFDLVALIFLAPNLFL